MDTIMLHASTFLLEDEEYSLIMCMMLIYLQPLFFRSRACDLVILYYCDLQAHEKAHTLLSVRETNPTSDHYTILPSCCGRRVAYRDAAVSVRR